MKNIYQLFAILVLTTSFAVFGNAQTARGLYIAYGSPAKPPKQPAKPPKKPTNNSKPPIIVVNTGEKPSSTGLPGTKVTIELSRNGKLSFVKPNHKFRSGDKIRLRLMTNFDGYISLLNVGSTGDVELLYPYQGADNRVYPSKDVQIPGSDAWIVFDNNVGTENLTVIMSKEPLGESSDNYRQLRQTNSRDLLIEYANDGVYAVCPEDKITKPVGFTLKLKHGK